MSWSSLGSFGTAQEKVLDAAISFSPTRQLNVGEVAILVGAFDNPGNATGTNDEPNTLSVTDNVGNTWTRIRESNARQAGAAGAHVGVFMCHVTTAITTSDTITFNTTTNQTAKAISGWGFSIGAGSSVAVETSQIAEAAAAQINAMTISGLTSAEYLFFRGIAIETSNATQMTATDANWTLIDRIETSGGGGASNMMVRGEWDILTGTGTTSDPTQGASDSASVFAALKEVAPVAPGRVQIPPSRRTFHTMRR